MYRLIKQEGRAKRGEFTTVHGVIQTPVFMNVGTVAAIKGAVSTADLEQIGTQVELSNTYHLHVRPGDRIIKQMGGLHKFMSWNKPILTDSGGFKSFPWRDCVRLRKRVLPSVPILTGIRSSWDRRRACRSSQIWVLLLPWLLMSVLPVRRTGCMYRIPWSVLPDGCKDARWR